MLVCPCSWPQPGYSDLGPGPGPGPGFGPGPGLGPGTGLGTVSCPGRGPGHGPVLAQAHKNLCRDPDENQTSPETHTVVISMVRF